jgi:hypothetical protein
MTFRGPLLEATFLRLQVCVFVVTRRVVADPTPDFRAPSSRGLPVRHVGFGRHHLFSLVVRIQSSTVIGSDVGGR